MTTPEINLDHLPNKLSAKELAVKLGVTPNTLHSWRQANFLDPIITERKNKRGRTTSAIIYDRGQIVKAATIAGLKREIPLYHEEEIRDYFSYPDWPDISQEYIYQFFPPPPQEGIR